MITRPTVLVLGAGASAPYGFPVAWELKQKICDALVHDSVAVRMLHEGSQISTSVFADFREAFRKSGQPSVDAFLEHRPEFIEVGKLAIAYCLIPYESEEALFGSTGGRGGDWYQYLSTKLNASFDRFGDNKLSVITFNYDRSLEHYLFVTLKNAHGRSNEECAEALRKIPIIHMYGQLSRDRYPNQEARSYEPDHNRYKSVGYAAGGITLLHDKIQPEIDVARQMLMEAERVCFLGFGYYELNLARLRLQDSSSRRLVFGTARGLIGAEVASIKEELQTKLLCGSVELNDDDNLTVLRRHLILG